MVSVHHTKCCQQNNGVSAAGCAYLFLFKDQLASAEKEYNAMPGSEVEGFKQTIAERGREIEIERSCSRHCKLNFRG